MNRSHVAGQITMTLEELERDPEHALNQAENREVTICAQGVAIAVLIPIQIWNAYASKLAEPEADDVDLNHARDRRSCH